jgi:hypothetical protein
MKLRSRETNRSVSRRRVSGLLTGAVLAVAAIVIGLFAEESRFNDGVLYHASASSIGTRLPALATP